MKNAQDKIASSANPQRARRRGSWQQGIDRRWEFSMSCCREFRMPTVKLFGGLRRLARQAKMAVSGATIREVLQSLCGENAELRAALWDADRLRDHVRVMIDGHDIEMAQGLDTPVKSNDEIAIFPPIAGGANNS
jgi:molybdopterin synthase sulfur carrier subunit